MVAELVLGFAISSIMGWSLLVSCALTISIGIVIQWLYRRRGSDSHDSAWLFECAYTLWRRGGLSLRMSFAWANTLKAQFGDRWSGQQAAEHQLSQWQN